MLQEKQGTRAQNWLLQKLSILLKIFTYSGSPTSYLSGSLNFVSIQPEFMNLWASQQRFLKFLIWAQKGSFANSFANSNKLFYKWNSINQLLNVNQCLTDSRTFESDCIFYKIVWNSAYTHPKNLDSGQSKIWNLKSKIRLILPEKNTHVSGKELSSVHISLHPIHTVSLPHAKPPST